MENKFMTLSHQDLGAALAQASSDIKWAEAGRRSVSTMNRLWRKYFQIAKNSARSSVATR